jgi:hypothetical protein
MSRNHAITEKRKGDDSMDKYDYIDCVSDLNTARAYLDNMRSLLNRPRDTSNNP